MSTAKTLPTKANEHSIYVPNIFRQAHYLNALNDNLFVLLPLVVVGLVIFRNGRGINGLLTSPMWAFAAAVVFGQTLVRLVSATIAAPSTHYPGLLPSLVAFWTTIIIVFGLVPACVVLAILLVSDQPMLALGIIQVALFVLSLAASIILASTNMIAEKPPIDAA